MVNPILLLPLAYFIGSVNFSILLFKILGKEDPRKGFSGNPGTTNVYRQAGLLWAALVLLLDMGRAVATAWVAVRYLDDMLIPWSGFLLVLGNRFPCFHDFKGGKGVANYLGFSTVLSPIAAGVSALAWLGVQALTKLPFLASFAMVIVLGTGTILAFPENGPAIFGTILTVVFILINHKKNVWEFIQSKK